MAIITSTLSRCYCPIGIQLLQKKILGRYFLHLADSDQTFKASDGPETLTHTTNFKKCGVKASRRGLERCIVTACLDFPHPVMWYICAAVLYVWMGDLYVERLETFERQVCLL